MSVEVQVTIDAAKEDVWKTITDIENASRTVSGIEEIEILERPAEGLVGLKWRETRTLFGKTATEVMWITNARDNEFYRTRAESHGAVYTTNLALSAEGNQTRLTMNFDSAPRSFGAKLMSAVAGRFMMGATRKALMKDLVDIKAAVEKSG